MSERLARLELALEAMAAADKARVAAPGAAARGESVPVAGANDSAAGMPLPETNPGLIVAVIAARKLRNKYFDRDLFFDPAWSILIDLYHAELSGQQLSVSAVCYGSGVAETTALRYIGVLEQRSLIERVPDPKDKRRAFLRLTPSAHEKLGKYFGEVRRNWAA